PFISGVAVITSLDGAQQIQTFRNLVLPAGYLEGILNAPDPRKAGIKAAIALGEELLSVTGVRGLNLSAAMGSGDKLELACDLAEIGRAFL
ncbi:MAG: methylenetetrahydrofolate reductase, partial [Meiothermus sp.]